MKWIWKKYCNRVDQHNQHIDYGNHEEYWEYETIFYPFFQAAFITLLVYVFTNCSFKTCVCSYIFSLIIMSLAYFINWIVVEKEPVCGRKLTEEE